MENIHIIKSVKAVEEAECQDAKNENASLHFVCQERKSSHNIWQ